MKTNSVTPADLVASVLALPPLARTRDGAIATVEQEKIVGWLRSAGVTTFLYGGIANFFNIAVSDYATTLDAIEAMAGPKEWVIPSIGPDFGKAMDQIKILRGRDFPSAMLLPLQMVSRAGVATGLRRLSDAFGRPLMVFFKSADYVAPRDLGQLIKDGVLCCVEYGIGGSTDTAEPFLAELLDTTGSAASIIDGAGERTIVDHARFGLVGYTTGSGVLAPHLSMALLAAVKKGDLAEAARLREFFLEHEALRLKYGQIPVLHDAVRLSGIADTGPLGPLFANVTDESALRDIAAAARKLKAESEASVRKAA